MRVKSEGFRKRHAIRIAAELPDNPEDALAILAYAQQLVRDFLRDEGSQPVVSASPILAFSSASETAAERAA